MKHNNDTYKIYNKCCQNCLLSKDRIVSPQRAKSIIDECNGKQVQFICHKASMRNENVTCAKFHEQFGDNVLAYNLARYLDIVEYVDQPDEPKLPTYKEMNDGKK